MLIFNILDLFHNFVFQIYEKKAIGGCCVVLFI